MKIDVKRVEKAKAKKIKNRELNKTEFKRIQRENNDKRFERKKCQTFDKLKFNSTLYSMKHRNINNT